MSEPFMGEIRAFTFNFVPKGWAACNGQLLPINQNQALFSLLGVQYGGNGVTNFALPNLQGRGSVHAGGDYVIGQAGGSDTHTLSVDEMPQHVHAVSAGGSATTADPRRGLWADGGSYGDGADTAMAAGTIGNSGGSQPHENMPPHLPVTYAIALTGIFPSRN
ncbi:phage tail protein [Aeromicrobium endophyticum]|uniref:Phage tail protein n=1 Tax=Aeromicrobium endophyticum TaxID=2292704 RepID=A0A371PAP1_9ACTN|nr:tail fiber protein [Aeromicrobium endophyticum]REK72999.1 phage tail protein [Aeromicrobium endophyticum]